MVIRLLNSEDHDTWLPLWRGYQTFYDVVIDDAVTAVTWRRLLDPDEPMHGALAVENDAAVGLVHYLYHRSTWTTGNYCYLQDLFVDGAARGKGVGRSLIEHVYVAAAAAGASRVHWLTHQTNSEAMKLYDKVADRSGFLQYRRIFAMKESQ